MNFIESWNLDYIMIGVLSLYLLIGLSRYALRSFLGLIFSVLYIAAFFFMPEAVRAYQPEITTLKIFFKTIFIISFVYMLSYLFLLLVASFISSRYYKHRKDEMGAGGVAVSKLFSIIFSLLQGTATVWVLVIITIGMMNFLGSRFPLSQDRIKNTYSFRYTVQSLQYIPDAWKNKFSDLETIFSAVLNPKAKKKLVKTSAFQKFQNMPVVIEMAEKIMAMQDKDELGGNPAALLNEPEIQNFINDEAVYEFLCSDDFLKAAKSSLGKRKLYASPQDKARDDFTPNAILILVNGNRVECEIKREDSERIYADVLYGKDVMATEFYQDEIKRIIDIR